MVSRLIPSLSSMMMCHAQRRCRVGAFVAAVVVVVINERGGMPPEITRQEVAFEQDAVLQRPVPSRDLAPGLRVLQIR